MNEHCYQFITRLFYLTNRTVGEYEMIHIKVHIKNMR